MYMYNTKQLNCSIYFGNSIIVVYFLSFACVCLLLGLGTVER